MCLYFECLLGIQKGIYMVPFLTCIMLVYFVVLRLSMDDFFFFAFLILYIFSFFVFNIFCCKISVAETVTPYSQVNSSWYFFFTKTYNIQPTHNKNKNNKHIYICLCICIYVYVKLPPLDPKVEFKSRKLQQKKKEIIKGNIYTHTCKL